MGLDDAGIQARGLFDFGLSVSGAAESKKGETIEVVELSGFGIAIQRCAKGCGRAIELFVACVPVSENNGVIRVGMSLQPGDEGGWPVARGARRRGQPQEARQHTCGESRAGSDKH